MSAKQVRITSGVPAEVLALACYSLGYRPTDSLVLVGVRPDHTCAAMRADLRGRNQLLPVLGATIPFLRREQASDVIALLFTPTDPPLDDVDQRWIEAAGTALSECHLRVADLVWVGPTRYRSMRCTRPDCCPPAGLPVAEALTDTLVAATEVADGATCAPTLEDLIADTQPRDVLDAGTLAVTDPGDPHAWLGDWATWIAHPDRTDWARAVAGINRTRHRDAVMAIAMAPGLDPATAIEAPEAIARDVLARRPDPDHVQTTTGLLAATASRAPAGWRAQPLAAAAFLAWDLGHGPRARLLTSVALADDPTNNLARLVRRVLAATIPPRWAANTP